MKYIKFLVLLFYFTTNSQIKSGIVIYKYSIVDNPFQNKGKNQTTKKIFNDYYINLLINSDKISYKLIFNENQSYYKIEDNTPLKDDEGYNNAALLTGGLDEIYIDLNKKIKFKQIQSLGENFLIKSGLNNEWELTQEKKIIGKYNCYKAIFVSDNKQVINAWYTPEIQVNLGPKGYGQLPGLILELKVGSIIYTSSKIILNPKEEIKVPKQKKGEIITEIEFEKLLKNYDKKRKKN